MPDRLAPHGGPAVSGHVVLVGLMGSGKTTVGRKLARLLGVTFVDADVEIEARTGRSVADWFAGPGEAAFRQTEADLLASMLAEPGPVVIGAGGGVVVTSHARAALAGPDVHVAYLHAEPAFLASRARAKPHRPLLAGDPVEVLTRLYTERDAWYRQVSDVVVEVRPAHDEDERPKWRLAEQVADALAGIGVADPARVAAMATVAGEADADGEARAGVEAGS